MWTLLRKSNKKKNSSSLCHSSPVQVSSCYTSLVGYYVLTCFILCCSEEAKVCQEGAPPGSNSEQCHRANRLHCWCVEEEGIVGGVGVGGAGAGRRESSGTMAKILLDVKVHQSSWLIGKWPHLYVAASVAFCTLRLVTIYLTNVSLNKVSCFF